jgi:predicted RNA-binding protein with PIN domain
MQIIVDGYNFIGRDKGLRGDLRGKRLKLIERLSAYRRTKGFPVTVVFDGGGGEGFDAGEGRIDGVEVVFSRGESADEVICRMAEALKEGCTVVSSDREVQRRVRQSGGISIYSGEFDARLKSVLDPDDSGKDTEGLEDSPRTTEKKGNPRRLSKVERRRQGRLRRL